jgi:hypothetical protein
MLFQITNKCLMGCPHCMDNSTPDGGMMTRETFSKALAFAKDNGEVHILISGGEPTEHPDLVDFCKEINNTHIRFSIASNGMWLGNFRIEWAMEKISKMKNFVGGQIYTNPKWYRLHEDTCRRYEESKGRWTGLKWNLDTHDIRAMSDIGRARLNDRARAETYSSPFHNMCLTACMTAAQVDSLPDFFHLMLMQQRFCTPMIDYKGDIHMSESCLCPSVGCNVNTHTQEQIWGAMKLFRPCGGCTPCRRFMEEQTPKMQTARALLGMGGNYGSL